MNEVFRFTQLSSATAEKTKGKPLKTPQPENGQERGYKVPPPPKKPKKKPKKRK
jgi:hypothetical protein